MARCQPRIRNLVPESGQRFEVKYPFIYDDTPSGYHHPDGAPLDDGRWRPGTRGEVRGQYGDDSGEVADAVGTQIITVVSIHKPGRFATRVFYTQKWIDPDGRTFGKNACRAMTLEKFRRRTAGFAIPYDVSGRFDGVYPKPETLSELIAE